MYWPIGPAKAYEQRLPTASSTLSHDGLATPRNPEKEDALESAPNGPSTPSNSSAQSSNAVSPEATNTRQVNGKHGRRQSGTSAIDHDDASILDLAVSKSGSVFATITRTTLTIWQTKPAVVLTAISRSQKSIKSYGHNVALLLRPDADVVVLQSSLGYLISYTLLFEQSPRAYQLLSTDARNIRRRSSLKPGPTKNGSTSRGLLMEGGGNVQLARLHFRMVIRLDAGISKALALDSELVVITKEPPAVQCIRWSPDRSGAQFNTEMLSDMDFLEGQKTLADIVHDKPMNLFAFVSQGGRAYAVQRLTESTRGDKDQDALFEGHIFHTPVGSHDVAVKAAINSRFSLIALACEDGAIQLYNVQNYAGGIQMLRRLPLPVSTLSAGKLTSLSYSPDGYCLFAGFENGWMTWSVYGQQGGSSFGCDIAHSQQNGDNCLTSVLKASWMSGGSDVLMLTSGSNLLWSQEFARSAVTNCYNPANAAKGLLQTSTGLISYQGDQMTDLATITADAAVWQHIQAPSQYLVEQWPIRASVISPDRRYIAIAGQRGLAHYSLTSGRWRIFQDPEEQNDFAVRGGMSWHQHILVAAVETSYGTHELRLYSRELPLESSSVLHSVALSSPVVNLSTSGHDGVLAYSYDNTLDHYIIDTASSSAQLTKVGKIALSGIIRAPARVRAVSWIVPDRQLQQGEASQDVASASVLFLIDGKLVLLQPSLNDNGDLKYDMRVIASSIEYFSLARDDPTILDMSLQTAIEGDEVIENVLRDSLWAFNGHNIKVWPDIQELLNHELHDLDTSIEISIDFYPFSAPLHKGLLVGAEAELTQRRDVNFSYFRTVARTTLFLPAVLRYYLTHYDISSALRLSGPFQSLSYFSHALEILLHTVLDEEVEKPVTAPSTPMHSRSNTATNAGANVVGDYLSALTLDPDGNDMQQPASLLPTVLTFLSHFPNNLDIILQCTRKTELRSWRTLFVHLPPPAMLFEQALNAGDLKTAGGYLLVLQQHQSDTSTANGFSSDQHTSDSEDVPGSPDHVGFPFTTDHSPDDAMRSAQVVPQAVRLLRRAQREGDWDLCKELARFLMALDESGETLRGALQAVEEGDEAHTQNGIGGLGLA